MKFELFRKTEKKELPLITPEIFADLFKQWNESPFVEESVFIVQTFDSGSSRDSEGYTSEYETALENVRRSIKAMGYSFGPNLQNVEKIVLGLYQKTLEDSV